MLNRIKSTIKHSAIYGLGTVTTKLIGFVLLPLYTKHITVSEYGILGILEITILILSQVLVFGQPNAYMRFYDDKKYREIRKSTLFTQFLSLITIAVLLNIIGYFFSDKIASLFSNPEEYTIYFKLCFAVISLRILNTLFLSVLRIKEKSTLYAFASVLRILVILGLNIYFVAFVKIGIRGILYAYVIGNIAMTIALLPSMLSQMSAKFVPSTLKAAVSFGFPLIFTSLAGMLLNMGDRYILKLLTNYNEVGLYNLGYKVAGVLNVFLIQSFSLALLPMAYKIYRQKGDKRFYCKMQTYFVFVLCWAGLVLAIFGRELIRILALNPDYWIAYQVVPYIILAYIFGGAKYVASLGLYLKRKTKFIAYITIGAAVINIGLNFLLIPKYKMIGAAIATVISFAVLFISTNIISNHYYKIPYENTKLLKMLLLAIILFIISTFTVQLHLLPRILSKIVIVISFPIILYPLNFYDKIELERIKQGWNKIRNLTKKKKL